MFRFPPAAGCALAAALFALPAHASSVVTFEKGAGAFTSLNYDNRGWPHGALVLNGAWSEAGFAVAFDGTPSGHRDETLETALDTIYGAAVLDDCYGGCPVSPSLNRLSVTRADGHPFTLDRIDIANSESALFAILEFVPEGTSGFNLQYVPLWHTDMTLSGTRSDGSTVTAALSSFDGVFPRHPGYPAGYGPNTLDLTGAGLVDLVSLEIRHEVGFTFDASTIDALGRMVLALGLKPLDDAMLAFLSRCASAQDAYCYEAVPGQGEFFFDIDYLTDANRLSGFSIDALHFDGGVTPPAPVPLPLPAMALLGGLGALGLLRRFRRG